MHPTIISLHQNVHGLAKSEGGSECFPCPTLTKRTSLRLVLLDWYEGGTPSFSCPNFQPEWSNLFTVKLRKLRTLEIFMGCYVFQGEGQSGMRELNCKWQ